MAIKKIKKEVVDLTSLGEEFFTEGELTSTGVLDERYYTESEVDDKVEKYHEKVITTSTYTLTVDDFINYDAVLFDTTSTGIAVTLPDRASIAGYKLKLKHAVQGSSNIVTINRAGSDLISQDELVSIELPKVSDYIDLFASSYVNNWEILDEAITCQLFLETQAGYGSNATLIPYFSNILENTGNLLTIVNDSTDGCKITIKKSGKYSIEYTTNTDASPRSVGISINATNPSASIFSQGSGEMKVATSGESTRVLNAGVTLNLEKDNIIRPHNDAAFTPITASIVRILITYSKK